MITINQSQSEVYFGQLKVATAAVSPGDVVVPDFSAGTCAAAATDGAYDLAGLAIVCNYDPYADTDVTNTASYTVAVGEYARLKALQVGDVFTTDRVIGTPVADAILAVNGTSGTGTCGKWVAIGSRTPVLKAVVIEVTTLNATTAYKLMVIGA